MTFNLDGIIYPLNNFRHFSWLKHSRKSYKKKHSRKSRSEFCKNLWLQSMILVPQSLLAPWFIILSLNVEGLNAKSNPGLLYNLLPCQCQIIFNSSWEMIFHMVETYCMLIGIYCSTMWQYVPHIEKM